MNKMKLSAIVLGIAAAGAFAQNAPAAAAEAPKAEAPVVNADSAKAAEEAKAAEIKKAEEEKAAAEAKKAEEEKAAAEAKKAEEEKKAAEAKKAEEEKAAAEAKKAEEEKAAAEAKKAEEAKSAEAAPAAGNTDPGEVGAAASSAISTIAASLSEGVSVANVQIKVSGTIDLEVVTNDVTEDGDLTHDNATTDADFNVAVQFNDKWSASLDLAFGNGSGYDGAYIQYKPADIFAVKVGDLTFSEGAFKSYYGYDDPADNAAGMKETTIRGIEIDLAGLELGLGFLNGENDAYDLHVAYEFNYAGQHLRPYFNYLSHQDNCYNTLHAGIDAGLTLGGFSFRAVYGLHMDYLIDSDDKDDAEGHDKLIAEGHVNKKGKHYTDDLTSMIHTFLIEPSFEVSMFEIKTAAFLALVFEGDIDNVEGTAGLDSYGDEVPEWLFIYAEPALKLAGFMKLGIPVEFHTNSLNSDAELSTLDVGARVYINPVEHVDFTVFSMIDIGIGDDTDGFGLRFGAEAVYSF